MNERGMALAPDVVTLNQIVLARVGIHVQRA
jgi:hypothetical protein